MRQIVGLCVVVFLLSVRVFAQAPDDESALTPDTLRASFVDGFNTFLREEANYPALAVNPALNEVAQAIAEQIGCTSESVNLDIQDRVAALGYQVFPGDDKPRTTRLPLLPIVNLDPIAEVTDFYAADIYGTNIAQASRFYREIGVGAFPCIANAGTNAVGSNQQYALFVILGVQPNVIPVVIGNGLPTITVPDVPAMVEISIHQEDSRPRPEIFGRIDSMRLSNQAIDANTPTLLYDSIVEWTVTDCGQNTIYYELTDTQGMILRGETSVNIQCSEE